MAAICYFKMWKKWKKKELHSFTFRLVCFRTERERRDTHDADTQREKVREGKGSFFAGSCTRNARAFLFTQREKQRERELERSSLFEFGKEEEVT